MISVNSSSKKIECSLNIFELFETLKGKYSDDKLFLLESLSGPNKDVSKSIIGFNPIFGIEFDAYNFELNGSSDIKMKISEQLNEINWIREIKKFKYQIPDTKKIWDILRIIESSFEVSYLNKDQDIAFGFFGYIAYDAIHAIEDIPYSIEDDKGLPVLNFKIYQGIINIDLDKEETYLTINTSSNFSKNITDTEILKLFEKNKTKEVIDTVPEQINSISDSITKEAYMKLVNKAMEHIKIGDIYQIQLGHEIKINSDIKPYTVYKRLRSLNPSPYMYYANLSDQTIIGASPELFLRIDKENNITMRPIAGTTKIGKTKEENIKLQQELLNDEKERAEHIMLVDLCRNDIGRVCQSGTLDVDELMIIEQYSHVSHIVSNVTGKKKETYDKYDVIAATFPAGTMTGAPKIRAMEIIEELENTRRGIYAGSIGFIGFNGVVETALCIRTAMYHNNIYTIRASGGIVYDSTPLGEWNESVSKLSATYFAITDRELKNESFIN